MQKLNVSQLHRLLTIPDPHKETIFGVVGRMELLISFFEKVEKYHMLLPFLKTYYLVTKTSAEKYLNQKRYFFHTRDYETLDIYFASLYFKPLFLYLAEGKHSTPWKTYFTYCEKPDGIPFLRLLLGINAHINGDLTAALRGTKYHHERDFFLVNDILQDVVPEITKYMVLTEHDLFSTSGLFMKEFFLTELHRVIEVWRSQAWVHAVCSGKKDAESLHSVAVRTERIGKSLIRDFESGAAVPFLLRTLSTNDASHAYE